MKTAITFTKKLLSSYLAISFIVLGIAGVLPNTAFAKIVELKQHEIQDVVSGFQAQNADHLSTSKSLEEMRAGGGNDPFLIILAVLGALALIGLALGAGEEKTSS